MTQLRTNLRGERVRLRALGEEDAKEFFALVEQSREHLRTWLPWVDSHLSEEHSEAFLSAAEMQLEMENGGLWGIEVNKALVGCVSLHWIQWDHRSTSLGYWLGKNFEGHGLAYDACRLLIHHCFEDLKLNRMEVSAAEANLRSLLLAQKLGFCEEGVRREYEHLHGKFWDHRALSMLLSDFRNLGSSSNQNWSV